MKRPGRFLDPGSSLIVALTFGLFVVAPLVKGLTHDLLLETGVFLISVKLVLMAYKNGIASAALQERLDGIQEVLRRIENANRPR